MILYPDTVGIPETTTSNVVALIFIGDAKYCVSLLVGIVNDTIGIEFIVNFGLVTVYTWSLILQSIEPDNIDVNVTPVSVGLTVTNSLACPV